MKKKFFSKLLTVVLAASMMLTLLPVSAMGWETYDEDVDVQSTDTVTQPFAKGTEDSNSFRIPALVTLDDGKLVAAADARWNSTYDGGGIDTLVAYSDDNGASWGHVFANYLGDNGNVYNGSASTCFIDPALAVDENDTVYMLCDLYPYGVALNGDGSQTAPVKTKGFNDNGKLLLSANEHSSYDYYLNGGTIYSADGTAENGYYVDEKFDLYAQNGDYVSNLFYADAPYQVVRTGFLYLTSSTDGGRTWSAPTLLNLKTDSEQVCLVAPGRGLVTDSGMIVFPVYSYNGEGKQKLSFVYSTDGENWERSTSFTGDSWSSESAVVELDDGTLRFFYRNENKTLCYVDYSGDSWGDKGNTGIPTNSNTQLSAISYSEELNGKQVILVSCPAGANDAGSADKSGSARVNGKIFTFTVGEGNALERVNTYSVKSENSTNSFMYSCLTELDNGDIAILYEDNENAWGAGNDNCYYQMSFKTVAASALALTADESTTDATVSDVETGVSVTAPGLTDVNVTSSTVSALLGEAYVAYDIDPVGYTNGTSATVTVPLSDELKAADKLLASCVVNDELTDTVTATKNDDGTASFTVTHFSTYAVYADTASDNTTTETVEVNLTVDQTSKPYTVSESAHVGTEVDEATTSDGVASYTVTHVTKKGSVTLGSQKSSLSNGDKIVICRESGGGDDKTMHYLKLAEFTSTSTVVQVKDTTDLEDATVWTVEVSGSGYKLKSGNYYLTYGGSTSGDYSLRGESDSTAWTYSSKEFSYQIGKTKYYIKFNLNWSFAGYKYNTATAYGVTTTEGTKSTTVSFTGVGEGTTTVPVGNVTYRVNVIAPTETPNTSLSVGSTLDLSKYSDVKITAGGQYATLSNGILTAKTEGTVTLTYCEKNTAGYVTKKYTHTVTISDGTAISIKENETEELSVNLKDGQTVEWTSADSSYVGVAGKYDASADAYTDTGVIVGHNVTESPVVVTATIYNEDGTVASTQKWLVTVTKGAADTNTNSRYIYVNVDKIEHCTVYYSINAGELVRVDGTGVLIDGRQSGHYQITFFAAPDEGYALTYMSATNGKNQYYTLSNGNSDGTGSDAWPVKADGYYNNCGMKWGLSEGNFNEAQLKVMYTNAIALGCDGVFCFTKNNNTATTNKNSCGDNDLNTSLTFVAQKLPEMTKEITSITKGSGNNGSGDVVEIGDTINYTITVYSAVLDRNYGTITYSNIELVDELTNQSWNTKGTAGTQKTVTVNGYTFTATPYTYTTSLELTDSNFGKVVENGTITNTAKMSYTYKSQYSSGSLTAKADAKAEVTISLPSYVVDFGLPVTIDLSKDSWFSNVYTLKSATVNNKYGEVSADGSKITFTPSEVFGKDAVMVTLNLTKAGATGSRGIYLIPASNVLYEETFLKVATDKGESYASWTQLSAASTPTQQAQKVGDDSTTYYVFGRDVAYDSSTNNSLGSAWTVSNLTSGKGSKYLTTTFYGNGFDLIGTAGPNNGYVYLMIQGDGGNKLKIIDTSYVGGNGDTTLYQVPLAHITGLTEGTYTVYVRATYRAASGTQAASASTYAMGGSTGAADEIYAMLEELYNDGFDIDDIEFIGFDESAAAVSTYAASSEDSTNTYRPAGDTATIDGFRVYRSTDNASYPDNEKDYMYYNVLDVVDYSSNSLVFAEFDSAYELKTRSDYESNGGPQNEIYLTTSQTVVFQTNLTEGTKVQVTARAVESTATNLNGTKITSNTEMYYVVEVGKNGVIALANMTEKGTSGMLALSNLKVSANTAFNPVTEQSLQTASLMLMSFAADTPVVDDPVEDAPSFKPELKVFERVVNLFRSKLVTLTITTSLDVETLEVNGHYLRPTNAWMVKMGWADSYTYVYVDTLSRGEMGEYQITAYDIDGNAYADYYKV